MSIFQNMGWFAPAIVMVAQGERSFCNWDEDSVSMAVEASRDCLKGLDKSKVDAHFLCSTTLPFSDRLCAGIAKTALNLRDDLLTEDFTNSLRCGTSALLTAFDVVKAGEKRQVLVTASDKREAKAGYFYEMWFGDGAASVLVGDTDVIAEFVGGYSVSYDFIDHYRGSDRKYDYMWEERWVRDEGYSKIIPEAVTGLFKKLSITMKDVDTLVFPCFFKTEHRNIAKALGATADKVVDNLHEVCGETGAAHPLVMLAYALDQAKPGDGILLAGFGQGCDALYFRVTENLSKAPAAKRNQGIPGKQENHGQLPQVPQVQGPDSDGNGDTSRSTDPDCNDGLVAKTQDAAGTGGGKMQNVRHGAVSADADLRQPRLPRRGHTGRVGVLRSAQRSSRASQGIFFPCPSIPRRFTA